MKIQKQTGIENHAFSVNFGLFVLRAAAVCLLIYFEIWIHLGKAWGNIWNEEPWGLVDQFRVLSLPVPELLSVVVILGALIVSLGILLGFLCRVNATILIVILGFLLISTVKTSDNLSAETIVLYVIVLITLLITGPGGWSLDHYLAEQRFRRLENRVRFYCVAMALFTDLNLSSPVLKAIERAGYTEPTQIQAEAIPVALDGRDIVGASQTGTGKTAAFALPIVSQMVPSDKPQCLILEPTRELAAQVEDQMRLFGYYRPMVRVKDWAVNQM